MKFPYKTDNPPQYDWIKVEVNYKPFYNDGEDHWIDTVGWNSVEEARKAEPNLKFREKSPWLWIGPKDFGYVPNYPKPLDTNPFNLIEDNKNKSY